MNLALFCFLWEVNGKKCHLYIHAVIAKKMKITTAKQYRPNWKNIFSQLGNYFFTVKYSLQAE